MKIKWDFQWSGWRKRIPGGTTEQSQEAPAMSMPSAAIFWLVTVWQGGTDGGQNILMVCIWGLQPCGHVVHIFKPTTARPRWGKSVLCIGMSLLFIAWLPLHIHCFKYYWARGARMRIFCPTSSVSEGKYGMCWGKRPDSLAEAGFSSSCCILCSGAGAAELEMRGGRPTSKFFFFLVFPAQPSSFVENTC